MKILILCAGNMCRSQMARGFLQSFDSTLQVYSAGTKPAARVNARAVEAMAEVGIDISSHRPTDVAAYLNDKWDYVITVCSNADATCPVFAGKVGKRMHIGFDDPSDAVGSEDYVKSEFRRVRDEIRQEFAKFYLTEVKKLQLPKCDCNE